MAEAAMRRAMGAACNGISNPGRRLVLRFFNRLDQNAAEGRRRRRQLRSFDDSRTIEYRLSQFVQRPRRRAVAGKLDDFGCGFRGRAGTIRG